MGIFGFSTENKLIPKGSLYLCVFALFYTFRISFLLNVNQYLLASVVSFFLLCVYVAKKWMFKSDVITSRMLILFLISSILATRGNLNSYIGIILLIIPFFFICYLRYEYKLLLVQYLDKFLSITIAISLIAWMGYLIGLPLPHKYFTWGSYDFDDYYLFLKIQDIFSYYTFPRFQYIFTEPGYFGCLCVLMIYLREYDFKRWQTYIYTIALILTFSLAGYTLFFIGLVPFFLMKKKGKLKYILMFAVLCSVFYYFVMVNQNNVLASMFAYRLQSDNGTMVEYNRTSTDFENWWNSYFLIKGDFLFGNDAMLTRMFPDELVGVDLRVYVARYGIFALIFYMWSMIYYYCMNNILVQFSIFSIFIL